MAPGITWYKYTLNNSTTAFNPITTNIVDYDAVEAGFYSNVMCIRPQFTNNDNNSIGKVRFWWYGTSGSNANASETLSGTVLPTAGWAMKYYVTDCKVQCGSSESNSSDSSFNERVASMMRAFNDSRLKDAVTMSTKTFSQSILNTTGLKYYKATWQAPNDPNCISMQPVPFFTNSFCDQVSQLNNQIQMYGAAGTEAYLNNEWSTSGGSFFQYSVGGSLNSYSCNLVKQVNTNDDFPVIFMAIKPPTQAEAGTWSGFSCRLSFIWPYTTTVDTTE